MPLRSTSWIATFLLVGSLVTAVPAPGLAQSGGSGAYDDVVKRLEEARRLVQQAERRERGLRQEITANDARRRALEVELEELSAVVGSAQARLNASERILAGIQEELDRKSGELRQALRELREAVGLLEDRAVRVYMSGPGTFLEFLLGSTDLREMVGRIRFLDRVFGNDKQRILFIRDTRARIEVERKEIRDLRDQAAEQVAVVRSERDRVATLRSQVEGRRRVVAAELQGQYASLKDVQQQKERYLRQQQELEAESRSIAAFLRGRSGGTASRGQGQMMWPTQGPVTSGYGWRTHPIFGTRRFHSGIDIGAPTGRPVVASAPGTVAFTGTRGGYGSTVMIDHGGGVATLYAHLSSISVGSGRAVGEGTMVGRVGCTGYCTGPHLHFEVRVNGEPQNPMRWLR